MSQDHTSVNEDLLLEFFKTFARFEFALKASVFKKRAPWGGVEPDWENFIDSIADGFDKTANEELQKACDYIIGDPPLKQILKDEIGWEENKQRNSENEAKFLLRMVKQIRNNLFHGAKHDSRFPDNTNRKTILLKSALTILSHCLSLDDNLKYYYDDAHI